MTEWTNDIIAAIHLKTDKRTHYRIDGINGAKCLYLAVQPSGGKQWQIRKTTKGKRTTKSLGPFPEVKLEEAVEMAQRFNREHWEQMQ